MSILSFSVRGAASAVSILLLSACSALPFGQSSAPVDDPVMRWDHRPEATNWTAMAFTALDTHAAVLPEIVPTDIAQWCPAYEDAPHEDREAFWTGLMSALARHESTWNPQAVGGGGRWFGLVQISPATARYYGCEATSGQALLNGAANISCAMRIWAETVPRDGVVAAGRGGVAADWGPFVQAPKREEMRQWISSQPYCAE
ncbi:transglycosylase SLT domain-containing protein [Jannaschia sp. CCS1]|uniref:transglycosylase SLT domain-containing protein n=1 Tax=Jannaschia sp. (strain CCS1) TaxID=290400 RepID=UPI000053A901|nr:transglycosylase SLT domain-containing protein [Jannaschia sp. CCS1]ABD54785.1 hypothetical protein Jann_1868 [Jannaschia sp. CCS1]